MWNNIRGRLSEIMGDWYVISDEKKRNIICQIYFFKWLLNVLTITI